MTDLRSRFLVARELGFSALIPYAAYRIRLASGELARRTPARDWEDRPFEAWVRSGVPTDPAGYAAYRARTVGPRFLFDGSIAGVPPGVVGSAPDGLLLEAEAVRAGRFRMFG